MRCIEPFFDMIYLQIFSDNAFEEIIPYRIFLKIDELFYDMHILLEITGDDYGPL